MSECFGNYFILNGELKSSGLFDNRLVYEGESVYEVLRTAKGNPIFFEDHMERLSGSVRLNGKEMLAGKQQLREAIIRLTASEITQEANLKIVFNYNNGLNTFLVYFTEPIYPTAEQYGRGVKGILFHAERRDPQSKIINHRLRSDIYHRLILEGAYEALLVNDMGLITEGSRSNIFFLRGNRLITSPDNMILCGITRKHIIEICREQNIDIELSCVKHYEIGGFESVFMTGTSPMVLPFCCIDDQTFNVGAPLVKKLRELYIERAEESRKLFVKDL
jgi:branched-chain amino acid aminotransferase